MSHHPRTQAEAAAKAKFIVKAVNCHDTMLITLKYIQMIADQHDEWWIGEFITELDAAITKAEV